LTVAENPSEPADDNDKARVDGADQSASEAGDSNMTSNLPMVVAPKLGAGNEEIDDDAVDETMGASAADADAPAAQVHSSRFLMLAASVAFAAAFGSFVGSLSGTGMVRFLSPAPQPAASVGLSTDAMREMKLELTELAAIKSNLDTTTHSTSIQLAKLSDRLDMFDQHAATAEVTGSIATTPPAPQPVAVKVPDRILQDWIVQDVQSGRALVQNRYGSMFDVGEGSTLPGVGRIDSIKRQDGQWLVLTERGTITSGH
jgi:hypothetical protein